MTDLYDEFPSLLKCLLFFFFHLELTKKLMAFQEGALAAKQLVQRIEDSLEVKT